MKTKKILALIFAIISFPIASYGIDADSNGINDENESA